MKKISFLILAMSFIMSCDSIRVTSDFNENIEFSDLKTYAFSKKGIDKVKMNSSLCFVFSYLRINSFDNINIIC